MPSYNHYCYQMPWGFITCDTETDEPPLEYIDRWGVNVTQAEQIAEGATVEVVDGKLVVTPALLPNDGIV